MRLVFFGSGAFGLPTLLDLARRHEIAGIVTQPDRPAGRGGALTPTPVGARAQDLLPGTPLLKPEAVNDPAVVRAIHGLGSDAWVVIAFGQKLGPALREGAFAINLHASLLPRWRGAGPIHAAILAGDAVTGNSVITVAERMDAGLVLGQTEREIAPSMTAGDLHDLLAADGPALVAEVLAGRAAGTLRPVEQDESLVTRAPKLGRADGWVDWTHRADQCRWRINGLSPWPGVTVRFRGQSLKLLRSAPETPRGTAPGAGPVASPPPPPPGNDSRRSRVRDRRVRRWFGPPAPRGPARRPARDGMARLRERTRRTVRRSPDRRSDRVLTLWDIIRPPRRRPPPPARPPEPGANGHAPPPGGPASPPDPARIGPPSMADRYDLVTRVMLARYQVRVRRWRTSMSGIAWEVRYRDGTVSRLIEAPRPRGPMSAAVFRHEIGHPAIGFDRFRPRCLEEYHAWIFALSAMRAHGLNVTDAVERRMHDSLHYAVAKARRRGIRSLPAELAPYTQRRTRVSSTPTRG